MKLDTLNVGTKFGTEHVAVEVSVKIAESVNDMMELSKNSTDFVVAMFNRGWRIWNQEASGARDFVKASTIADRKDIKAFTAKVQAIINEADPSAPAKRTGRPAAPKEVKVTDDVAAAMKGGDINALAALLAAQGVKINFTA